MKTITEFFMQGGTAAILIILSLTICLGLMLGKVKIKGFSLGITLVLFVGIALSSMGIVIDYKLVGLMKDLGLVLFIFTVGLQVGPSFFASFRKGGLKLNLLAVAIVALGVVTTVMISKLSGETLDVMAGVYSGAISSTPGMSAAQQAVSSMGVGSADVIANSYAVTYPIGVVGPIICCILIRNICNVRLEQEPVNVVETVENAPLNTVGNQENAVGKSLMVVFIGMCLGVAVGSIAIPVGLSVPMKLGLAGGPLIVAILIGHFGTKKGFIDQNVTSGTSMSMLRELGISLFLASVGLSAGGSFVQTIVDGGYMWVVYGLIITMLPLLTVGLFARRRLKVNFYTLMGLAGGASTDTPALAYANSVANNPANSLPASSYATVYPLTVFMRIFTAQMMVMVAAA
ncbi:MAG: hypothetical protein IJM74_05075 [Bacteroidales bacterium]|nr:hypothetical protein [Bacteroidales bacterium]